jgi:DNA-binding GntR family transcriptional regulator
MAEVIEITRVQLHAQVEQRLRNMLVEGRIQPGDKLNERELCDQLRVSRTPLREAIKLLAAEGMVDLLPNRGAIAVKLSETDVMDTFEVLAELEGLAGDLAAQRATEQEISELKAMHYEMLACFARGELPTYYRLNAAIHSAFNEAARNPVLKKSYSAINARVQCLRFRTNLYEAKWKLAVKEHDRMVECLVARDSAGLRAVMSQHVCNKRDTVLELMRAGVPYPSEKLKV